MPSKRISWVLKNEEAIVPYASCRCWLVFAASLMMMMLVLMLIWAVLALRRKFTGQPVTAFVMRTNPRTSFDQVLRRGQSLRADDAKTPRRDMHNVTDVEPKL